MKQRILKNSYGQVGIWCFLLALLSFLPAIISGEGILTLVGDYNFQQIPFTMACNRAIKSGSVLWDWSADLGSSFIGAYSFYTLGSPFFWLSLLVPEWAVPYVMGPIYILKYVVAGIAACAYMKRFVKDEKYAVLGGVLYAFSGFSVSALMYYHFHDVVALFPILLLGLEKLVVEEKKGFFAFAVAVNALVNYVFFIGEVIFIILYFIIRFLITDVRRYAIKIIHCFLEGALGVAMAAVLFIPSVLFVLSNPRVSQMIQLPNMFIYHPSRYLQILKALLVPADPMALEVAIQETDYTTCELYLPVFGFVLAIIYVYKNRKDWLSRMVVFSLVIMFVPVLNSAFYMFNNDYYARWFYMPVLIFALATVKMLEGRDFRLIRRGAIGAIGMTLILMVCIIVSQPVYHKYMFIGYFGVAIAGYLFLGVLNQVTWRQIIIVVSVFVLVCQGADIYQMRKEGETADYIMSRLIRTGTDMNLPEDPDYRIHYYWAFWNGHLVKGYPTASSFTSTISGSIFEFFDLLGIERTIVSQYPEEYEGIPALLSVKYRITTWDTNGNLYYRFYNGDEDVHVYEKDDYIPFGFVYDYYMTVSEFKKVDTEKRHCLLMKAIIINDEDEDDVSKTLSKLNEIMIGEVTQEDFNNDVEKLRLSASENFKRSTAGFSSEVHREMPGYIFYSVPFDEGWSAFVNGEKTEIIKAEGFMAVRVDAGESEVEFHYMIPGLIPGVIVSIVAWIVWGIVIILYRQKRTQFLVRR